jgi:high-affinity iron transporter
VAFVLLSAVILGLLLWQGLTASGNPNPAGQHVTGGAAIVDTAILVFREGLETILVLSAITASMQGANQLLRRPIAVGAAFGFLATLLTWVVAVALLDVLQQSVSSFQIQAATGLLAILVLLVVMNWFFHRVYWTGWISLHNRRKRSLLQAGTESGTGSRLIWGLALLGFASLYREGFEVVLVLQGLRLQVGSATVGLGALIGLILTGIVAVLTFAAHRRLPYKRMLVLTGVMLGMVLLVMVGEEAQEMQLAGWLPTTTLGWPIPSWMGLWFSVFPTVETLLAQVLAAFIVIGSYGLARYLLVWRRRGSGQPPAVRPERPPAAREPRHLAPSDRVTEG